MNKKTNEILEILVNKIKWNNNYGRSYKEIFKVHSIIHFIYCHCYYSFKTINIDKILITAFNNIQNLSKEEFYIFKDDILSLICSDSKFLHLIHNKNNFISSEQIISTAEYDDLLLKKYLE